MTFDQKHNKDFYFEYHRIGNKAFRDKVRYYDDNKSSIGFLSYEERVDVELDYVICLFEIGKYHKFLSKVDALVEVVIVDNIFIYNDVDIYNDLLFKKSACLYNTGQYTKSEKVLKSVVKLDPENDYARTLYGKCKRKQVRNWYRTIRAIGTTLLMSAVLISFIEFILRKYFYNDFVVSFGIIKVIFFIAGICSLICVEAYLTYIIGKEIGYKINLKEIKKRILP